MDSPLNISSPSPDPLTKPLTQAPEAVTDSGERRLSRLAPRQREAEQLVCPRCHSTNTKFCYYNNYNLSQPRHFCKSCRRYWTRGGALRNIPFGGGTRRAPPSNKATTTSDDVMGQTRPGSGSMQGTSVNLNEAADEILGNSISGSGSGGGFLPFSVYGTGFRPVGGCEQCVSDWPMEQVSEGDGGADVASPPWQMGGVAEGEADYFSWPDLAISTPAKAFSSEMRKR